VLFNPAGSLQEEGSPFPASSLERNVGSLPPPFESGLHPGGFFRGPPHKRASRGHTILLL